SGVMVQNPAVTALKDGGYAVTWTSGTDRREWYMDGTNDVKIVIVNADGSIRAAGETPDINASYITGAGDLTGNAAVNTLDGKNGVASFDAGARYDSVILTNTTFTMANGGTGEDTLIWTAHSTLVFADIAAKVSSFAVIHLGDQIANTLTLTQADVEGISERH